jgi:hypothetical protein
MLYFLGLFLTLYSGENIFPPYIYMSNSTQKDIYICHKTENYGQSYCSKLNKRYKLLPEAASNLAKAKDETLKYLKTILPDNENITDADIQIHSGTLRKNTHGTEYVTANSNTFDATFGKVNSAKRFVAFIPTKFKFLSATPNTSHTNSEDVNAINSEDVNDTNSEHTNSSVIGGHRRYKKKRTARKTTRRGKKSNRTTRGKK